MSHVLTHSGSRSSSSETGSHLAGKSALNCLPWCPTITGPHRNSPAPFSDGAPSPSFEKAVPEARVRSNCPIMRSQSGHCRAAHSLKACVRLWFTPQWVCQARLREITGFSCLKRVHSSESLVCPSRLHLYLRWSHESLCCVFPGGIRTRVTTCKVLPLLFMVLRGYDCILPVPMNLEKTDRESGRQIMS